jgi:septal ring factor EnvC (AmiA/AmiB activator)
MARGWRGLRRALLVLTALALAAGVIVLGVNDLQTHHQLRDTRLDLAATQSSLRLVRDDLSAARSNLINSQTQLGATRKSLSASEAKLATAEQDLQGLRNSLSDAKGRVTVQSGQIEALKSCLNGVSIALRDAANLDYVSAVSALDAVQVSCDVANKILG